MWRRKELACQHLEEVPEEDHMKPVMLSAIGVLLAWRLGVPERSPMPAPFTSYFRSQPRASPQGARFLPTEACGQLSCVFPPVSRKPACDLPSQTGDRAAELWGKLSGDASRTRPVGASLVPLFSSGARHCRHLRRPEVENAGQTANIWPLGSAECEKSGIFSPTWKK